MRRTVSSENGRALRVDMNLSEFLKIEFRRISL
jgi:hypothetical protein